MVSRPEIGRWYAKQRRNKKKTSAPNRDFGYQQRSASLKQVGYATYTEYKRSPLWKRIRTSIFMVYKWKCGICSNKADHVHHLDYSPEALTGSDPSKLIAVCKSCHDKIELDESGNKRTFNESCKAFRNLISAGTKKPE